MSPLTCSSSRPLAAPSACGHLVPRPCAPPLLHLLRSLAFLFDKHLSKALQIIDQGGVFCFTGERSGRRVYEVQVSRGT